MFTSYILTIQSAGYSFNQAQHFKTTFPVQYNKYYLQFIYLKKIMTTFKSIFANN
jgi:hypothetical protein